MTTEIERTLEELRERIKFSRSPLERRIREELLAEIERFTVGDPALLAFYREHEKKAGCETPCQTI